MFNYNKDNESKSQKNRYVSTKRKFSMKSIKNINLMLLGLAVFGLAQAGESSKSFCSKDKDKHEKPKCVVPPNDAPCCYPNVFQGAGSTLQGQADTANDSITIQTVNNYNAVHNCPQFAYNGTNPATGLPYAQGSSAGVSQTEAGIVLFGGTDVPPSASLVYPTGDLLNFPIVVAAVAVIQSSESNSASTAYCCTNCWYFLW